MVALSIDFTTITGTILASQFASNFSDLNGKFGSIYGSDIHPRAGIINTQLRDRYSKHEVVTQIVPYDSDSNWAAGLTVFTFPTVATLFSRRRIKVPVGYLAYLASVEVYALDITAVGAVYPTVFLYKNTVAVTGASFALAADNSFYVFERSVTPFSSPLLSFANNDTLEYYIGSSDGATPATGARGVVVQENWKHILIA